MREQPLALGAIGLAVGAVLASAAPRTRVEDEWMGDASDRLTDRAKEAGREQLDRASDALRSATSPHDGDGTGQGEKSQGAMQGASGAGTTGTGSTESWPYASSGTQQGEKPSQGDGQKTSVPGTAGSASESGASKQEWPSGRRPSE